MIAWPDGLDPGRFLDLYWQKKPLFLAGALPGFRSTICGDELAGLACEPDVESRLVTGSVDEWELRHGPFDADDFKALPGNDWTLLVQDVDKHIYEAASILDEFDFLPRWRLDDVMISYAAPGGSVGPHLDEYDVFLVQAAGYRRWSVDREPADHSLIPGLDLRILQSFDAKESWRMEVGDVLYLPPGAAHHGISDTPSMTISIGFRAPSLQGLLATMLPLLEGRQPVRRYSDPDLDQREVASTEISREAVIRAQAIMALDEKLVAECLGRNATELKPWLVPDPPRTEQTPEAVVARLEAGGCLEHHKLSRFAWHRLPDTILLFVDGESLPLPVACAEFAVMLCERTKLNCRQLAPWLELNEVRNGLYRLLTQGSLQWMEDAEA
jgi:50S ribosomal protein L16 3-hydroxylase